MTPRAFGYFRQSLQVLYGCFGQAGVFNVAFSDAPDALFRARINGVHHFNRRNWHRINAEQRAALTNAHNPSRGLSFGSKARTQFLYVSEERPGSRHEALWR